MIEVMEHHINELEERLDRLTEKSNVDDGDDAKLVPDDVALNLESVCDPSSSTRLVDFTDRRTAVMMMMCVMDPTTAQSGTDCSLVDTVREAAMSVAGEVLVEEEAWNSIIIAVEPDASQSAAKPMSQLIELAARVNAKVRIGLSCN